MAQLSEGLGLGLGLALALDVKLAVGEIELDAEPVRDGLAEAVRDELGVPVSEAEPVTEDEADFVPDLVILADGIGLELGVGLGILHTETYPVPGAAP